MIEETHQLKGSLSKKFPRVAAIIGILFLVTTLILIKKDPHHALHSYITSYMFFLGISLGAMFLVLIQHLSRAGWSVTVRRVPEILMKNIGLMIILFIPVAFKIPELFHWADPSALAHDYLLQVKQPYLNKPFFLIRSVSYFVIWILISRYYFNQSTKQDIEGGEAITDRLQNRSAVSILLFSLSFTFAAFDWLMSLSPHWFSTIFGVYVFANSVLAALCATSLIYLLLRKFGYLKEIVTVEHYHDLGKLIYGFVIFWAYVAFSQYFLIWYANIPEETVWYLHRLNGSWKYFAAFIIIGHFIFPLFGFMSRYAKRHLGYHAFMASFILIMCYCDTYYIAMPNISKTFHLGLADITSILGIGGLFIASIFYTLGKVSLIPVKDPRLSESLHFENH